MKTVKFKDPKYVGDPINAIRIFNEKEVDELIFLDIKASREGRGPIFDVIRDIASECFMPLCYGGGIRSVQDIDRIFHMGVEKVSINRFLIEQPDFIRKAAEIFGSQSIIASIDVKKNLLGKYRVYDCITNKMTEHNPVEFALRLEDMGAGEILLNSVDRDGTMDGYDIELLQSVTSVTKVPVIAAGGAGKIDDFAAAINKGRASAVAAGSMFVFHGKYRAVLITYPSYKELEIISV